RRMSRAWRRWQRLQVFLTAGRGLGGEKGSTHGCRDHMPINRPEERSRTALRHYVPAHGSGAGRRSSRPSHTAPTGSVFVCSRSARLGQTGRSKSGAPSKLQFRSMACLEGTEDLSYSSGPEGGIDGGGGGGGFTVRGIVAFSLPLFLFP